MEAVKVGNYTLVVDEIEWWVARIECLCSVYFAAWSSDAPTLSSGGCCEANRPHGGAILAVFSADPFVDIGCEQKMVVIN
jgi:hypothetical protein